MSKQTLLGCGILKKEINWLIKKNNWLLDTVFLDSALHIDFEKLSKSLSTKLAQHSKEDVKIFYGACHPLMDDMLEKANVIRTKGQNCVDILLGNDLFTTELTNGAYFLLEDWALRWNYISIKTFGKYNEITRQIFQSDRKYMLGIITPCSGDFTKEAEMAAKAVGLPLRWKEIGLDDLEEALFNLLDHKGSKIYGR